MKKASIFTFLLLSMLLCAAQDTVINRNRNYYYSQWYDTCECYHYQSGLTRFNLLGADNTYCAFAAFSDYTERPLEVIGIAGMVSMEAPTYPIVLNHTRDTEYFYLAYYDPATNSMNKLDSCRWDTVAPKIMKLEMTEDPDSYVNWYPGSQPVQYCYVYESYFDKPVVVDSAFYMIGSANSNEGYMQNTFLYCYHKPFYYSVVSSGAPVCGPNHPVQTQMWTGAGYQWQWQLIQDNPCWGPFLPIVRPQHLVTLHSADSSMGSVVGGTYYPDSTVALLQARPNYGYRFSHWNDGDSVTPRQLLVTSDTSLTAYFESRPFCKLNVDVDNPAHGSVTGDGYYPIGDAVTITATPANIHYRFLSWQDGNRNASRRIVLTQDTSFTAYFLQISGISDPDPQTHTFTLSPNPASGTVAVQLGEAVPLPAALSVSDASGKEVLRHTLRSRTHRIKELPAGIYFVSVTTLNGSSTQKLVVR